MHPVIPPISKELLKKDINNAHLLRETNKNANQVFILDTHSSPNLMKEIGRLREISYRDIGSGTGKDCDIDELDIAENGYKQLIVWNPETNEILGGYRFLICAQAGKNQAGEPIIGTSRLFTYSEEFINNYLPYTIELGRSFIPPEHQSTGSGRRSLFVLDNLWDGLGALVNLYPHTKYFLGQVSLYINQNPGSRNIILYFLKTFFPGKENLARVKNPVDLEIDHSSFLEIFNADTLKENIRILSKEVRKMGESIPPLINTYMNLSPSMQTFGTVRNPYFRNMEDTGILLTIDDIYQIKKERHINA